MLVLHSVSQLMRRHSVFGQAAGQFCMHNTAQLHCVCPVLLLPETSRATSVCF